MMALPRRTGRPEDGAPEDPPARFRGATPTEKLAPSVIAVVVAFVVAVDWVSKSWARRTRHRAGLGGMEGARFSGRRSPDRPRAVHPLDRSRSRDHVRCVQGWLEEVRGRSQRETEAGN